MASQADRLAAIERAGRRNARLRRNKRRGIVNVPVKGSPELPGVEKLPGQAGSRARRRIARNRRGEGATRPAARHAPGSAALARDRTAVERVKRIQRAQRIVAPYLKAGRIAIPKGTTKVQARKVGRHIGILAAAQSAAELHAERIGLGRQVELEHLRDAIDVERRHPVLSGISERASEGVTTWDPIRGVARTKPELLLAPTAVAPAAAVVGAAARRLGGTAARRTAARQTARAFPAVGIVEREIARQARVPVRTRLAGALEARRAARALAKEAPKAPVPQRVAQRAGGTLRVGAKAGKYSILGGAAGGLAIAPLHPKALEQGLPGLPHEGVADIPGPVGFMLNVPINTLANVLSLPANALPMVYIPAHALAARIFSGDSEELSHLITEFTQVDPVMLAFQGRIGDAVESFERNPLYGVLPWIGAGRAISRAGRPRPRIGERPAVAPGLEPRTYSRGRLGEAVQRKIDAWADSSDSKLAGAFRQARIDMARAALTDLNYAQQNVRRGYWRNQVGETLGNIAKPLGADAPRILPIVHMMIEHTVRRGSFLDDLAVMRQRYVEARPKLNETSAAYAANAERIAAIDYAAENAAVVEPLAAQAAGEFLARQQPLERALIAAEILNEERAYRRRAAPEQLIHGQTVYHGTRARVSSALQLNPGEGALGRGIYAHSTKEAAGGTGYGKGGKVLDVRLVPNARVVHLEKGPKAKQRARAAVKEGAQVVTYDTPAGRVVMIADPAAIAGRVPRDPGAGYIAGGEEGGVVTRTGGRFGVESVPSARWTGSSTLAGTTPADLARLGTTLIGRGNLMEGARAFRDWIDVMAMRDAKGAPIKAADRQGIIQARNRLTKADLKRLGVNSVEDLQPVRASHARELAELEAATEAELAAGRGIDENALSDVMLGEAGFFGKAATKEAPGEWVLVPTKAWNRAIRHRSPETHHDLLAAFTRGWKGAILPTSTKWYFGNWFDITMRSLLDGLVPGANRRLHYNRGLALLEKVDPQTAVVFKQGQLFGETGYAPGARYLDEHALRSVQTGGPLLAKLRYETAGLADLANAYTWARDQAFHLNSRYIETPPRVAKLGKVAKQQVDALLRHWDDIGRSGTEAQAWAEVAQGLRNTPTQAAYLRQINDLFGDWISRSVMARKFVVGYAPFYMWFRAATKFIFYTLPAKHPVKTGMLAASANATERERMVLGLDLFKSNEEGPVPAYLMGGLPRQGGGIIPTATYSSFGVWNEPGANVIHFMLPQISGILLAGRGVTWTGDQMTDADGKPVSSRVAFAVSLGLAAETFVPFLPLIHRASGLRLPGQFEPKGSAGSRLREAIVPPILPGGKKYSPESVGKARAYSQATHIPILPKGSKYKSDKKKRKARIGL